MNRRSAEWPDLDLVPSNLTALWRAQTGWRGDKLGEQDWRLELPASFVSAVRRWAERAADSTVLAIEMASLAYTFDLRQEVETRLEGGLGFCVLRGVPPVGDDGVNARLVLALSLLFGRPVAQTLAGDIVARVENRCGDRLDPSVRGHSTAAELAFHSDRADRVVLYCVRPGAVGGDSSVVSALHLRDELKARFPHLLKRLEQPIPQDRRGEQGPDERPYCEIPVFATVQGAFVCRYLRRFIEDALRHPGAPALLPETVDALDHLDALMAEPGAAALHRLEAGDIQILNNAVVLHARSAFKDDPSAPRLLLRTWLSPRTARPLPDTFAPLYGAIRAGEYRGGVWPSMCALEKAALAH